MGCCHLHSGFTILLLTIPLKYPLPQLLFNFLCTTTIEGETNPVSRISVSTIMNQEKQTKRYTYSNKVVEI
jgi:hypothetical protein